MNDKLNIEVVGDAVCILADGRTVMGLPPSMAIHVGTMILQHVKHSQGNAEQAALAGQALSMQDPRGEIAADFAEAKFSVELHEASDEITIWDDNNIILTTTCQQAEQLAAGLLHIGMTIIEARHPGWAK